MNQDRAIDTPVVLVIVEPDRVEGDTVLLCEILNDPFCTGV
jgi:hypothetical protein